jgi:hypothetical protein
MKVQFKATFQFRIPNIRTHIHFNQLFFNIGKFK